MRSQSPKSFLMHCIQHPEELHLDLDFLFPVFYLFLTFLIGFEFFEAYFSFGPMVVYSMDLHFLRENVMLLLSFLLCCAIFVFLCYTTLHLPQSKLSPSGIRCPRNEPIPTP